MDEAVLDPWSTKFKFSTCFCYGKKVLTVIEMHMNLYIKKVQ